jgi:hypothetical protein
MPARKDFSQVAFDVMRQATGQAPKEPSPAPKPGLRVTPSPFGQRVSDDTMAFINEQKKAAPLVTLGAAKKASKPPASR